MPALRVLDLFCKQGGASAGYAAAGMEPVGVDIEPQPRYPWEFYQGDALEYLDGWVRAIGIRANFDLVHASPPCQRYSATQVIRGREHPDLIGPVRAALLRLGVPYVIENVEGARGKLRDPVMLCGGMFGIETYRHRLFEASFPVAQLNHRPHKTPVAKMGRMPAEHEYMHIVGNFSGAERARRIMGMPWASRDGLREAIPAVYTQYIGQQFTAWKERAHAAA